MKMRGGSRAKHRASVAQGKAFEEWVEGQHVRAGFRGALAHVVHNQGQSRVVGWKLIYTGAGVADYTGCLHGGRYLAVEAKSTGKDRLPKAEITPVQQRHLDAVTDAGGLAMLLVEFKGGSSPPRRYAIPWRDVIWTVARTAESIREEDIPGRYQISTSTAAPDYLAPHAPSSTVIYHVGKKRVIPA